MTSGERREKEVLLTCSEVMPFGWLNTDFLYRSGLGLGFNPHNPQERKVYYLLRPLDFPNCPTDMGKHFLLPKYLGQLDPEKLPICFGLSPQPRIEIRGSFLHAYNQILGLAFAANSVVRVNPQRRLVDIVGLNRNWDPYTADEIEEFLAFALELGQVPMDNRLTQGLAEIYKRSKKHP